MTLNTINVEAEVEARRKRAEEALASGQYRIERVAPTRWTVTNGNGVAYNITVQDGKPVCNCPDYRNRGDTIGTCKHIEMVRLHAKRRRAQPARPGSTSPSGHEPSPASGPEQPQPQPASRSAHQAAPTGEGLEDPVVPWGKRKGQRLSQIAREDPEYLFFLARRMEPRSDEDRILQEAARAGLAALVAEAVERAFADQAAMPVLPFGEEKGKALDKAHPKWVSILAKKSEQDARSFQDLVLYAVARRLHEARQAKKRQAKASLDAEVLIQAIREAVKEAIVAALEAARQQEVDREAIVADLADLRRRVEALEKAARAPAALAAREAMLAAR